MELTLVEWTNCGVGMSYELPNSCLTSVLRFERAHLGDIAVDVHVKTSYQVSDHVRVVLGLILPTTCTAEKCLESLYRVFS